MKTSQFKVGDTVRMIYPGGVCSGYREKAIELVATKWIENKSAYEGEQGVIRGIGLHPHYGDIALIDFGEKEILCCIRMYGRKCIKFISRPQEIVPASFAPRLIYW